MVAPTARESFDAIDDGTQITTGATVFTTVTGTGTRVARTAAAIKGARGAEFGGTNVSAYGEWSGLNATIAGLQIYFTKTSTLPTGAPHILGQIRNSGGNAVQVYLTTAGVLQFVNGSGGSAQSFNSGSELPNGDYVLTVVAVKGTTTSNGRVLAWLRNADTDASVENKDTGTTYNTGTTNYTILRGGKMNSTGVSSLYLDEIAYSLESTAEIDRVADPVTGTPTQEIRRYQDFSAFTGGVGALEATVTQDSGPTITPVQESDLVWYFVDDPDRDTNVVLDYTVAGATSGSASGQIIVLPGGGQLIIARSELYTDGTGWA